MTYPTALPWAGVGQYHNAGGKAYIVPTPGAELLTNGSFAAWTADNPDGWTVYGEVGADPEVSEVGAAEGHGEIETRGSRISSAVRPIFSPILLKFQWLLDHSIEGQ